MRLRFLGANRQVTGGLLRWIGGFQTPPRRLFLVHGEEAVATALADQVRRQLAWETCVPRFQESAALE